jgi:hypothetical protein
MFHFTKFVHIAPRSAVFSEIFVEQKMCALISTQLLSETFLIVGRIQRDTIVKYKSLYVKYILFLIYFNETLIFSAEFQKNTYISRKSS